MALLYELNRGLDTDPDQENPSIHTEEYYENLDAAEIVNNNTFIEKMAKSWEKYAISHWQGPAKEMLLEDMREAMTEGILRQIKKDLKTRHPHLSNKQLDYAVTLPISLSTSGTVDNESIASTIRGRVESAVTKETIDALMDKIQTNAGHDIQNLFMTGRGSNILSTFQRIVADALKASARLIDKVRRTNSPERKLERRFERKLTIAAETKLMKDALKEVARDKAPYDMEHGSGPRHASQKLKLSDLSGEISAASAEVVRKVGVRKERRSGGR